MWLVTVDGWLAIFWISQGRKIDVGPLSGAGKKYSDKDGFRGSVGDLLKTSYKYKS